MFFKATKFVTVCYSLGNEYRNIYNNVSLTLSNIHTYIPLPAHCLGIVSVTHMYLGLSLWKFFCPPYSFFPSPSPSHSLYSL